jgi:hypothetical protein
MARDEPLRRPAVPERELDDAARIRRERDLSLSMNERLERLHNLCMQAAALRRGRARAK